MARVHVAVLLLLFLVQRGKCKNIMSLVTSVIIIMGLMQPDFVRLLVTIHGVSNLIAEEEPLNSY